MGVKKINGGVEDFINKFVRARGGDSTGTDAATAAITQYIEATGGIISDYTDPGPGKFYRSHIFTSSGTFAVTQVGKGAGPTTVEYLVVAGGGSGDSGSNSGGGGGAGGFRTNVPGTPHSTSALFPISVSSYSIVVGSGAGGRATNGSDSTLDSGGPNPIASSGGGSGGGASDPGSAGGSGGGGGSSPGSTVYPGGASTAVSTPSPWPGPATQGSAGGAGQHVPGSWEGGGGGGGAGYVGQTASNTAGQIAGAGGTGLRVTIAGPSYSIGAPGPDGSGGSQTGGWVGGGGGGQGGSQGAGGSWNGSLQPGGPFAGGGKGGEPTSTVHGVGGTGGGGGGGQPGLPTSYGQGGSGIVVVRYQSEEAASTAKATGGAISFYGGKTIHTFLGSGTFAVTDGPLSIEYVALGGGAGGGDSQGGAGGGGGAGAFVTGPETANNATSYTVTVGTGGSGAAPPGSFQGNKGGDTSISGTGISVSALGGGGGLRDTSAYTDPVAEAPSMPYTDYASGGGYGGSGAGSRAAGPGGGYAGGSTGGGTDGFAGGGGGGAGGAGVNGVSSPPDTATAGNGGFGRQIPSTFRNPGSSVGFPGPTGPVPGNNPGGDTSGLYWFGGGGGGGVGEYQPAPHDDLITGKGGGPGAPDDGWAGGGSGGSAFPPFVTYPYVGSSAKINSGAGGGGSGYPGAAGDDQYNGGSGGSGIVLIAYPS